jgi:hypothetical protein
MSIENEPFYFESDTLALRNNPDYSCLLKTLILLEAQRARACQDLEKLIDMKEAALRDPIPFVRQLQATAATAHTTDPLLPTRQQVYVLPEIDWNKYYDCVDLEDLENIRNQKLSRVQSLRQTSKLLQAQADTNDLSSAENARAALSRRAAKSTGEQPQQQPTGRNYNKPWTVEEQRSLEELLIEYPPEDNESARWRKIATKLGTRSPLQVQSHCQKYFIKLAKAGLPVPGRVPNMKNHVGSRRGHGRQRFRPATLLSHGGGLGGGRLSSGGNSQSNSKRMVGRGSSLNEISSMWSSFNPPITMSDELDHSNNNNEDEEEFEYEEEGDDGGNYEDYYNEEEGEFEDVDERFENENSQSCLQDQSHDANNNNWGNRASFSHTKQNQNSRNSNANAGFS